MENYKENRCENCLVRQLNALKCLNKDQLKRISNSKISKSIKKGETLFEEGEKLKGVFCVRDGVSKLSKMSDNGKDTIVRIATRGEVLGQRSVISQEKTNLSAVAINDMEVCYIPKTHLLESLNENPSYAKALLLQMAKDLKFSDNVIVNIAQKTVKQRVSEVILYLHNNFGIDSDGFVAIALNREDIANIVGTAKETCIRTLTSLKKQGWIVTEGKRIKIEDHNALLKLVENR